MISRDDRTVTTVRLSKELLRRIERELPKLQEPWSGALRMTRNTGIALLLKEALDERDRRRAA